MALLDVSEIFDDPDLTDTLVCVRATSAVGDNGRPDPFAASEQEISFTGIIQDPGFDARQSLAEGQINPGNVVVYTMFRLTAGSDPDGTDADTVRVRGTEYVVKSVSDWTNWGSGYLVATLVQQPLNP